MDAEIWAHQPTEKWQTQLTWPTQIGKTGSIHGFIYFNSLVLVHPTGPAKQKMRNNRGIDALKEFKPLTSNTQL